jgi:hypothetical protein
MFKTLKVAEMKCVDDSDHNRGVRIACGDHGRSCVTLIFDKAIPHPETDALLRTLEKMKLTEVTVETP